MSNNIRRKERGFNLCGWLLFIVCAGCFIASGIASGDILYLVGSIVFLVACLVFIVSLVIRGSVDEDN